MKFLAIFAVIALVKAQEPNPAQFVAQIVRHTGTGEAAQNQLLGLGVLIRKNFIITAASIVHEVPAGELRVFLDSTRHLVSNDIRSVNRTVPHPNYNNNTPLVNNFAILEMPDRPTDAARTVSRRIRALAAGSCRSFTFPPGLDNVLTAAVTVTTAGCRNNQTFCFQQTFPDGVSGCPTIIGSPIVCESTHFDFVVGIANAPMHCNIAQTISGQVTLANLWEVNRWIEDIAGGAEMNAKISGLLVLLGVAISKFFM